LAALKEAATLLAEREREGGRAELITGSTVKKIAVEVELLIDLTITVIVNTITLLRIFRAESADIFAAILRLGV